jgi:hypothetical protein
MPKKIAKKDLPAPGDVPTAAPLVATLDKRRTKLTAARDAATKDGTLVKHDPKYRLARKKVKRAQRRLRVELIRAKSLQKPAPAAEG